MTNKKLCFILANPITVHAQIAVKTAASQDPSNADTVGPSEITFETKYQMLNTDPGGGPNLNREALKDMLTMNTTNVTTSSTVTIPYMLPKFVKVTRTKGLTPVETLLKSAPDAKYDNVLRNISISLTQQGTSKWWVVKEVCEGYNFDNYLKDIQDEDCDLVQLYFFNEKQFPATLKWLSGGG